MVVDRPAGLKDAQLLSEMSGKEKLDLSGYLDQLTRFVGASSTHVMIDSGLSRIVGPMADLAELMGFAVNDAARSKATAASTSAVLMSRLPAFPTATVAEVIDIRDELSGSVLRFRASMATASAEFDVLSSTFAADVERVWRTQVAPAIEQLQDDVHEKKISHWLPAGAGVGTAGTLIVTASTVFGKAITGPLPAPAAIGALALATSGLYQRERTLMAALRKQPFWYLYEVDRRLSAP